MLSATRVALSVPETDNKTKSTKSFTRVFGRPCLGRTFTGGAQPARCAARKRSASGQIRSLELKAALN